MPPQEVFPRSLVKQAIFQIRFPNLFYLADRIGEFQIKVMKTFPKSQLMQRRQFLITAEQDKEKREQLADNLGDGPTVSIWCFESEKGVKLEVSQNSLSLVSLRHKSYRQGEERFRDAIEFACNNFLEVVKVPLLKRVGLRYTDVGPVPERRSDALKQYYNTALPLHRFPLEQADELRCMAVVRRGNFRLRYSESLANEAGNQNLLMDTDAWAEDVDSSQLLGVADQLHDLLWDEFNSSIRDPVRDYMRKPLEDKQVSVPPST